MTPTFHQYLQAGYAALWVNTHEERRAIDALSSQAEGYKVFSWDIMAGMRNHETGIAQPLPDPVKALESMNTMPEGSILFYKDAHKFLQNINVIRTVKNMIPVLKSSDRHLIFISPVTQIPIELEKDVTTFPFNLPTIGELMGIAQKIVEDNGFTEMAVDEATISAAQGMTLTESENAMALSVVTEKNFSRKILETEKLQAVKKSGIMELYPAVPESELGGYSKIKSYAHSRKRGFHDPALANCRPKGIINVGPPGTGKTLLGKVFASIFEFPLIRLDIASLKGSLVGESERKMRQATDLIDAISPCVLLLDELDKAIGGVQSSSKTDGGTTAGMFGHFLTWMQESKTPKYIIATINDIDDLLAISQGALVRRFDDVFFVDLPSETERADILGIMNRRYGTQLPTETVKKMEGWTGAEIEKFVTASVYDGQEEAFRNIKPIYYQNRDKIEKAREWARSNARMANGGQEVKTTGRRIKA